MVFLNKCCQISSTRLRIGVLKESVYIYGVCQQMLSSHFNSLTHRCIKWICLYIYGVCQQMLSIHFNSLTHRCIKIFCLYIWRLSTNVIKSLLLAYA